MTDANADGLTDFCGRHGVRAPITLEPIGAGRNSKVMRLRNDDGQWILKEYYPQGASGRDRLGVEFAFLQYLQSGKVAGVAQPIGMDRALHSALYSQLPGERPAIVTADYIAQAAQFIADANRDRTTPQATALAPAADACFSRQDHLALTRVRLAQLMAMTPQSAVEDEARTLVAERFAPLWQDIENALADSVAANRATVPTTAQILSPSDFGFHNTLAHRGRLSFVDFEYAGWDDPVKLICDFICQPELPITTTQGMQFIEQLTSALPHIGDTDDIGSRVEQLLPVHRLKWCCILLNEFRPEHRQRRIHAGIPPEGLLAAQLTKATSYFNSHLRLTQKH